MKNLILRIGFALVIVILSFAISDAGSIQLKSGEAIETKGTWEDDDRVFGFVDGKIVSYPKSEVKSWHDVTTVKSQSKTKYSKFETVEKMIEDFHDYNLSNGTFKVLNNDPLHIQLSPMVVKGDTKKTVMGEVNRTIVYGVYRSFIHTPIDNLRVTVIPMEIDLKTKKDTYLSTYKKTVHATRDKALLLIKKHLILTEFSDLITTTQIGSNTLHDQWSKEFSIVYYQERGNQALNDIVNELAEMRDYKEVPVEPKPLKKKTKVKKITKEKEYSTDPNALDTGVFYRLSKRTPLMPSPDPSDPIGALKKMKYINSGGLIMVHEKYLKNNTPWYKVSVHASDGSPLAVGWINSIALLGQKLLVNQ